MLWWVRCAVGLLVSVVASGCGDEVRRAAPDNTGGEGGTGGAGGATGGSGGGCVSSQACIDEYAGVAHACIRGSCRPLRSAPCDAIVGDALGRDPAMWLGFLGPLRGDFAPIGQDIARGLELQLEELAAQTGGVPRTTGDLAVGAVLCDTSEDPLAALTHLTDTVETPAIVGPSFSGVLLAVSDEAVARGVLLVSPSATSPEITGLVDQGLVWRTAASDAVQAKVLAALSLEQEAAVRLEVGLAPSDAIRVAVAYRQDTYGSGIRDALESHLVFNGAPASANGANYVALGHAPDGSDASSVVTAITSFEPHIVIALGIDQVVDPIATGIDAAWGGPLPRPRFLFSDGALGFVLAAAEASPYGLGDRAEGSEPRPQGPIYEALLQRYEDRFGMTPALPFAANAYDAGAILTYAASATSDPPTGAQLAGAFGRLVAGDALDGVPGEVATGFAILEAGGTFDYEGASGPLDFDLAVGEAEGWVNAWCVQGGEIVSVPYYDPKQAAVVGSSACP